MKLLILNKKNFIALELKKFNSEINSFFKNSYCSKIWNYVKLTRRSLTEMEELKKFQSSTFDTIARRRSVEDQDTILELSGRITGIAKWNKLYEWFKGVSGCWINSQWKFPRYQSTSVIPTSSNSWRNAKTFFWSAEPQRRAAKHLGHTWCIGKRFCKSRCVIISTLSSRIESMEFIDRGAASFIHSGKEWKARTRSRSEMPAWTVSQKFSHLRWGWTVQRVMEQTNNDCRSRIFILTNSQHQPRLLAGR